MEESAMFTEDAIMEIGMATVKASKKKTPAPGKVEVKGSTDLYPKFSAWRRLRAKRIEWLKETLEAIFPGNWDLQEQGLRYSESSKASHDSYIQSVDEERDKLTIKRDYYSYFRNTDFIVIIRFPEITVKSRKGKPHLMKEVYIQMPFLSSFGLVRPTLGRGSKTYVEYQQQYSFSHARQTSTGEWSGLCFGNTHLDTDILSLYNEWDPVKLESILHQWVDYLSWESLDGGPYVRIENLVTSSTTRSYETPSTAELDKYYKELLKKDLSEIPISHKKLGRLVTFNIPNTNKDLWRVITSVVSTDDKFPLDEEKGKTFIPEGVDSYLKEKVRMINTSISRTTLFTFQERPISMVVELPGEIKTDKEVFAHESIRDYLVNKLIREFNKHYLNEFRSKYNKKAA